MPTELDVDDRDQQLPRHFMLSHRRTVTITFANIETPRIFVVDALRRVDDISNFQASPFSVALSSHV